ncbi:DUF5343 domain-containing protein [Patescibacteria group bacterium]|nr:DUF5343 domain-containing protein [Patescibacteria group bacterium]
MVEYPPYVDAYGKIKDVFNKIKEAAVPPKFTQDFLHTKLGLKSSSYRAMVPLLKRLQFIDEANIPTAVYRDYRDESKSKIILAQRIKAAYSELFAAHEYAHDLKREDLNSKLATVLGTSKDDKTIPKISGTFIELRKLADFEQKIPIKKEEVKKIAAEKPTEFTPKLGISYTINLNLPATPDIEIFDAIFKSLKEHLLK